MTRRVVVLIAVLLLAAGLAACQPDPTTGRPPPKGATGIGAFRGSISSVTAAQLSHSWRPGCPVAPSSLRKLGVDYWGFDGRRHTGPLVVLAREAVDVLAAFRFLYDERFQIQRIHLVDDYGGSDDASMDANNTSAFNCRPVTGGSGWSEHAYGTAIDINPVQNPYVRGGTVVPAAGRQYLDRGDVVPGMIVDGGPVVTVFRFIGWGWGGDFRSLKDYQHVSASGG